MKGVRSSANGLAQPPSNPIQFHINNGHEQTDRHLHTLTHTQLINSTTIVSM
jgi:hypothetical protein